MQHCDARNVGREWGCCHSDIRKGLCVSEMMDTTNWDDLRLFLSVARLGGLSAATRATGLSPATLGRRVTALERQMGEPLFVRSHSGFGLTPAGRELLRRAEEVEASVLSLRRWREGVIGEPLVRVACDPWMSQFLCGRIDELWHVDDGIRIELVTAHEPLDAGRRAAEIEIRSGRPTETSAAGRLLGRMAFTFYCLPKLINGVAAALFIGAKGDCASLPSSRWLAEHHGDRIALWAHDLCAIQELAAAGAGIAVLPCFVGDGDPRLARLATPPQDLTQEQWLVMHHEDRHNPHVRRTADRIASLWRDHSSLFAGAVRGAASRPTVTAD